MRNSSTSLIRAALVTIACMTIGLSQAAVSASRTSGSSVHLAFDYAGALALIDVLGRETISSGEIDRLLEVHGLAAMVDNVTRFIPTITRSHFRHDLQTFVETGEDPRHDGYRVWGFQQIWDTRIQVGELIRQLRVDQEQITREVLATLQPYRPMTESMTITVYFVSGGVSDGFVPERSSSPALYVNLARAQGDLTGVVTNLAHEIYHVLQYTASRRNPELVPIVDEPEKLASPERLLAVTLWEGVADYVTDPRRAKATGPYIDMWKARYERNTKPARLADHFALFDATLQDLLERRLSWEEAYEKGFAGNDSPFYFVGYEMTRVIELHCGTHCIGELFEQRPVEFFRQYIALYKSHPDIPARFSPETEAWLCNGAAACRLTVPVSGDSNSR